MGHNMIAYLLNLHEQTLDEEHFGIQIDEAILYYTAHVIYLSLVSARTEATGREKAAAKGQVPKRPDHADYEEIRPTDLAFNLSPFGLHYQELMGTQGPSVLAIDVQDDLIWRHSKLDCWHSYRGRGRLGRSRYRGRGMGCCG